MKFGAARQLSDNRPTQLEAMRRKIADPSRGISCRQLRTAVIELIRKLDLRGAVADFGGRADLIRSLLEMDRFSCIEGLDLMERPSDLPLHVQWRNTDLNQPVAALPAHSIWSPP
jgi:hypothetical protein